MAQIEFFFDLSSPWTYLAFNNIQPILTETKAHVVWRPFLVGGVFNAVNRDVYQTRAEPMAAKIVHNFRWLHEWAQLSSLPLLFPTEHHPLKSVVAMRACCALEKDQTNLQRFSSAAFDAYFTRGENLDDPETLRRIADKCNLDGMALIRATEEKTIKDLLRSNTEEAILRGAYGSPTMLIGQSLYFGNDQLPLVKAALSSESS